MAFNQTDYQLLQEELKCLRKRFKNTVSTSGGYMDGSLTAPNSSVYPNSYYDDCECVDIDYVNTSDTVVCQSPAEDEKTPLGDLAQHVTFGSNFAFLAKTGVFYKSDSCDWDNRNTGLSDASLNHGTVDPFWWKKAEPNENNIILWTCGDGFVRFSDNAGKSYWKNRTPQESDISDLDFIQIIADPFNINTLYALARSKSELKSYMFKTSDNGQSWIRTDMTNYNSRTSRIPIWMSLAGNGGANMWVTTWADDTLCLNRVNFDSGINVAEEILLGSTTLKEFRDYTYIAHPKTVPDSSGTIYVYGRLNNPQSLGLSHVISTENAGSSWNVYENSFGDDWVGSMRVTIETEGERNILLVRNTR